MFKNTHLFQKAQLFDSVAFLITRSEKPTKHGGYFKLNLSKIKDQQYNLEKKADIVEFLEYIVSKNRIDEFPNAQLNQNPPKCKIMDHYDQMGWKYLDIRKV